MPIGIKHALNGKYDTWRKSIRSELASLHNKGIFRMDNIPLGRNAIGNKRVFKAKAKPDGSIDCFKVRLVAQRFSQRT
jgi:hypothetical protein